MIKPYFYNYDHTALEQVFKCIGRVRFNEQCKMTGLKPLRKVDRFRICYNGKNFTLEYFDNYTWGWFMNLKLNEAPKKGWQWEEIHW